ncbi:MAG: ParA family protein [Sneathiella sp.]|nr:ParA family protein [Sneathiella sp.]
MKVIAVASQKGGSGKTTLAGHLAVQAEMAGQGPVALVDTDPQGSLSEWWNEREAETPLFARTTVERLGADIGRMEKMGIKLLFVDTPPAITSTIANVIGLADLLIIPTRPSPHDLRAVGATVELAEGLNTPLIFVVNGATPRARITSEAAIALSQHGTLAPSVIHQRVDFASSMIDGRTTMELDPSSKSSDEISKLWSYIQERIARMSSSHPTPPSIRLSASTASNGAAYN